MLLLLSFCLRMLLFFFNSSAVLLATKVNCPLLISVLSVNHISSAVFAVDAVAAVVGHEWPFVILRFECASFLATKWRAWNTYIFLQTVTHRNVHEIHCRYSNSYICAITTGAKVPLFFYNPLHIIIFIFSELQKAMLMISEIFGIALTTIPQNRGSIKASGQY